VQEPGASSIKIMGKDFKGTRVEIRCDLLGFAGSSGKSEIGKRETGIQDEDRGAKDDQVNPFLQEPLDATP